MRYGFRTLHGGKFMESYQPGDRVRVKAKGVSGTVTSGSTPAKRSVGIEPSQETFAIDVKLDDTDYSQQFTHEEVEPA